MNIDLDYEKAYMRKYRKENRNKIRRMRKLYEKLMIGKQKLAADNRKDLTYSSGMVGCFHEDHQEQSGLTKKRKRNNTKGKNDAIQCRHCGLMGHSRPTSMSCLKNKRFLCQEQEKQKKQDELARENGTYTL
jgi:hypothetical protein